MAVKNLWVVMPVYNEEEAVSAVIEEWQKCLSENVEQFTFCIINDGSKDGTLGILRKYEARYKEIKIIDKPNSGHGQTCIYGYQLALDNGAEWIFQIDSDGQCDPVYFPEMLSAAENNKAVYGYRKTRDDGLKRSLISRFVTLFTFFATGQWVRDANVPYRLIHRSVLEQITGKIPESFHLANILVSVLTKKLAGIKWINIHFRDRAGGTASVKTISFVKHGFTLFRQLKEASA
ncbi:MAG: glycosyltransferase family 2 protein [Chitinophagales bacterium]|nr:glycosyltransferase family 2 protein [Chitinophagales bacterium]